MDPPTDNHFNGYGSDATMAAAPGYPFNPDGREPNWALIQSTDIGGGSNNGFTAPDAENSQSARDLLRSTEHLNADFADFYVYDPIEKDAFCMVHKEPSSGKEPRLFSKHPVKSLIAPEDNLIRDELNIQIDGDTDRSTRSSTCATPAAKPIPLVREAPPELRNRICHQYALDYYSKHDNDDGKGPDLFRVCNRFRDEAGAILSQYASQVYYPARGNNPFTLITMTSAGAYVGVQLEVWSQVVPQTLHSSVAAHDDSEDPVLLIPCPYVGLVGLPTDDSAEAVTVIGQDQDAVTRGLEKAMDLAMSISSSPMNVGRSHKHAAGGASTYSRDVSRYLRQREEIERIENSGQSRRRETADNG
ncbi:hypothetical protein PG984_009937 [Apiospora sp. TS-2023a]